MTGTIYKSCFTLVFSKKSIESEWQNQRDFYFRYFNKLFATILLLCSIGISIGNSFFIASYEESKLFRVVLLTSYISSGFYFVSIFFAFFAKDMKMIKYVTYFNYFLFAFVGINFRYPFLYLTSTNAILFYILFNFEILARMVWVLLKIQGFMECLILNTCQLVILWIIYPPNFDEPTFQRSAYNMLAYTFTLTVVVFFSYILERQQKNAFYFASISAKKADWFTNVFENMNTGFLSIKNGQVSYMNSYLANKIVKSKKYSEQHQTNPRANTDTNLIFRNIRDQNRLNSDINTVENLNLQMRTDVELNKDANLILSLLLSNLNIESINDEAVGSVISNFNSFFNAQNCKDKFVKIFCEHISKLPGFNNFVLIGDSTLDTEDSEYSYEIFCRMNSFEENKYVLDFLLNDVTRTKLKEKQNAEFKYKSLFLSKIAHEFKNPLICVSELINNLFEVAMLMKEEHRKEMLTNLTQIKSLSNFLLVLVKDLNYFSQINMENAITIDNKETNIMDVVNFCKEITESLLRKSNKADSVNLKVNIDKSAPAVILIDEWRLKQILINLLSNAVKFTIYGEIELEVIKSNGKIKFSVKDTGIGIQPESQGNLFKPLLKSAGRNNERGSGLGLSIVYELTAKLGEVVEFTSEHQRGSCFWFSIEDNSDRIIKHSRNSSLQLPVRNYFGAEDSNNDSKLSTETVKLDVEMRRVQQFNKSSKTIMDSLSMTSEKSFVCVKKKRSVSKFFDQNSPVKRNKEIPNINFKNCTLSEFLVYDQSNFSTCNTEGLNIIVADDEPMIRQSVVRTIKSIAGELGIKINTIEVEDGIETVFLVYKCIKQGINISLIFSDQNMHFMKGSDSSRLIKSLLIDKNISSIPFYLVTAYHGTLVDIEYQNYVTEVLPKPLNKVIASNIISTLIKGKKQSSDLEECMSGH